MTGSTPSLAGQKVLVTGANRGIGAEVVRAALVRGARIVVAGMRSVGTSPFDDERVEPILLDVSVPAQIRSAATDHSDVDLIVSNAGVPCYRPVLGDGDDDEQVFAHAMEVNFLGPLRLARAFADTLRHPGAGIVFVLSVGAVALSRSSPIYSASKAASLMTALAVGEELRAAGGRAMIVLPGFVDTEMSSQLHMPKANAANVAARILDGWLAGERTVWPDRFADAVRLAVGAEFERLLDDPRGRMTEVQNGYLGTFRA